MCVWKAASSSQQPQTIDRLMKAFLMLESGFCYLIPFGTKISVFGQEGFPELGASSNFIHR